jgi:hypothetical protein
MELIDTIVMLPEADKCKVIAYTQVAVIETGRRGDPHALLAKPRIKDWTSARASRQASFSA